MNKPFASAVLVLALAACSNSAPVSTSPNAAASTAGAPPARITASAREDKIAAAKATMPTAMNIDPQTDKAIDVMLGNHDAYHKAINDFQKAVAANDSDTIAAMVKYPITLQVDGKKVVVENSGRFKQFYPKLFTPETTKAIAESKYSDVLIARKGVLLGDGQTWMSSDCSGTDCKKAEVKIITIEPTKASN